MGTAQDAVDHVGSAVGDAGTGIGHAGSAVGSTIGDAGSAIGNVPHQAVVKAQGNPLAAGLIAFGAGLLVFALLPTSTREREAAQSLKKAAGGGLRPGTTMWVSKQRLGKVLTRLESLGLVCRERGADARNTSIMLTPRGRAVLATAAKHLSTLEQPGKDEETALRHSLQQHLNELRKI